MDLSTSQEDQLGKLIIIKDISSYVFRTLDDDLALL